MYNEKKQTNKKKSFYIPQSPDLNIVIFFSVKIKHEGIKLSNQQFTDMYIT